MIWGTLIIFGHTTWIVETRRNVQHAAAECRKVASAIFKHQARAVVALDELGNVEAIPVMQEVGEKATISQLQYMLRYRTRRPQRQHHWNSSPSRVAQKLE